MSDAAIVAPVTPSTPPAASAVTPAPVTPISNQAAADAVAAQAAASNAPTAVVPVVPPAEVAYALALPKDAQIEASAIERVTTFAKDHKLAPDVAQKALDLADAEVKADRNKQNVLATESFKTMATKQWVEDVKADTEFGGDKYLVTVEEVKRAADRFLTDADREVLNTTGWGNHPMLVKMFARIGRAISNDKLVNGNSGGAPSPKTDAQALYPNMKP